jgi:hypothetical protein
MARALFDAAGQREVLLDQLPTLTMPTLVIWGGPPTPRLAGPGRRGPAAPRAARLVRRVRAPTSRRVPRPVRHRTERMARRARRPVLRTPHRTARRPGRPRGRSLRCVQNDKAGQDRRGIRGPVAAPACGYDRCPQEYDQHDRSRRSRHDAARLSSTTPSARRPPSPRPGRRPRPSSWRPAAGREIGRRAPGWERALSTQHNTVSKQMRCQTATDLSHADKLHNPYASKSLKKSRGHSLKRRPRNYRTLLYLCASSNR